MLVLSFFPLTLHLPFQQAGYQYGQEAIAELVQTNSNVKSVMNPEALESLNRRARRKERAAQSRNSFTDLAAQISKIPGKRHGGSLTDVSVFDEDWLDGDCELEWRLEIESLKRYKHKFKRRFATQ